MKIDIEAYLSAVELEADSEAIYHKGFGVTGAAIQIPRVLSLLGPIKRYQKLVNTLLPILRWCYGLIFAPFYFSFRAMNVAQSLHAARTASISMQRGNVVYLATSSGANLACLPQGSIRPELIITTPFRGGINANILPDAQRLPVLHFVNLSDICGAWCRAVLSNWYLLKNNNGANVFWGYTAFEWYLVYRVLKGLEPKTIWVSNHHDRWLMLALSIPGAAVKLVQHGRLYHILPSGEEISYKREIKIRGVTSIYALDSRSEYLFSNFVDSSDVTYYRLLATIALMPWRGEEIDHLKILIIGGSNRLEFYLELMNAIRASIDHPVALAIRHHPLQKMRLSDLNRPTDYWELSSDDPVPEPDLVVSYGSSIDDQLFSSTQARFVNYAWSDQIDLEEIVQRVQSVAIEISLSLEASNE